MFPDFEIELDQMGHRSRVSMNGKELRGVTDISVSQKLDGPAIVTISFLARSVNRSQRFDPDKERSEV